MVYIQSRPPPDEIQTEIDAVFQSKLSPERKGEISHLAQELCESFAEVLSGAAGEDDSIELIHKALSSMGYHGSLTFPRKADWHPCIKPYPHRYNWDLSFMDEPQQEAEDSPVGPRKRQQLGTYPSPRTSGSATTGGTNMRDRALGAVAMPPPPSPRVQAESHGGTTSVKTPRPDVTIGLRNDVILTALASQGLTKIQAKGFLEHLQEQVMYRTPDRCEPVLCSEPTQRPLNIRFPFLIVEGKSYATGKPIFDAQNQAAVSGASALKILHDLADLADRADRAERVSPGSHSRMVRPLVFSICTEGPYHELWAHYTTMENGVRMFNMGILKTCHGSLQGEVLDFLIAVDNVMSWGTGDFLADIVARLGKAAKRAGKAGEGRA